MKRTGTALILCCLFVADGSPSASGQESVVGSPHDLSVFGPGEIRAVEEEQVCIFCHAPHHATGQRPLWNRASRDLHYRIYQSSTTDARIDQPSGPSKMCLSCHDGAMAIGLVASRPETAPIVMTQRTIPPGPSDLTEDLSDDHPIGFRFDRALASRDRQLKNPDVVSPLLPLGVHGELHCTTCHDPHNNELGDFLRMPQEQSTLCLACHDLLGWETSSHAISPAPIRGRGVDPRERLPFHSVADNACASCHQVHSADHPERLLRFREADDNCLSCHDGGVAATNLVSELRKPSAHWTPFSSGRHDPAEDPRTARRHVTCADCHNPHAVMPDLRLPELQGTAERVGPTMQFVSGIDRFGHEVDVARFEYEVCFKCHAESIVRPGPGEILRALPENNTRLEFDPSNPSFHPVAGPRNNPEVVSLIPPLRVGSVIGCTDCHNSDEATQGGLGGVSGPHGSIYEPLLIANYETDDFATESPHAYALCYRCHDRQSILGDESFPLHRLHVVDGRSPCSACHDAHGISRRQGTATNHSNLINFDLSIVNPAIGATRSRVLFEDLGPQRGTCTLTCHNVTHVNFEYGR